MPQYLLLQYEKYPLMQVEDFVKHIYQATFGCEHVIGDNAYKYLCDELQRVEGLESQPFELLSDTYCRVYLPEFKRCGYDAQMLVNLMKKTPNNGTGQDLQEALQQFYNLVKQGKINLSLERVESFLAWYRDAGYPAVHHSETYRKNYAPSYRVVSTKFAVMLPVLNAIANLIKSGKNVLVAIDGCCGSGKTFYSSVVADLFGATVIHADDFFVPSHLRNEQRILDGKNIHWERLQPVLSQVKQGKPFVYQRYNCSNSTMQDVLYNPATVTIVEGSYSLIDELKDLFDLKIRLTVDGKTQLSRLSKREQNVQDFVSKWIPYENYHLNKLVDVDLVIDTSKEAK